MIAEKSAASNDWTTVAKKKKPAPQPPRKPQNGRRPNKNGAAKQSFNQKTANKPAIRTNVGKSAVSAPNGVQQPISKPDPSKKTWASMLKKSEPPAPVQPPVQVKPIEVVAPKPEAQPKKAEKQIFEASEIEAELRLPKSEKEKVEDEADKLLLSASKEVKEPPKPKQPLVKAGFSLSKSLEKLSSSSNASFGSIDAPSAIDLATFAENEGKKVVNVETLAELHKASRELTSKMVENKELKAKLDSLEAQVERTNNELRTSNLRLEELNALRSEKDSLVETVTQLKSQLEALKSQKSAEMKYFESNESDPTSSKPTKSPPQDVQQYPGMPQSHPPPMYPAHPPQMPYYPPNYYHYAHNYQHSPGPGRSNPYNYPDPPHHQQNSAPPPQQSDSYARDEFSRPPPGHGGGMRRREGMMKEGPPSGGQHPPPGYGPGQYNYAPSYVMPQQQMGFGQQQRPNTQNWTGRP